MRTFFGLEFCYIFVLAFKMLKKKEEKIYLPRYIIWVQWVGTLFMIHRKNYA